MRDGPILARFAVGPGGHKVKDDQGYRFSSAYVDNGQKREMIAKSYRFQVGDATGVNLFPTKVSTRVSIDARPYFFLSRMLSARCFARCPAVGPRPGATVGRYPLGSQGRKWSTIASFGDTACNGGTNELTSSAQAASTRPPRSTR